MEKTKIIFEDDDLMVIDKPAFVTTTKEKKDEKNTLEDYLGEIRPNNLARNGIIHRLDKGTTGLIMVAKTEKAFIKLKKQFKERTIIKKYYCLVEGDTSFDGSIDMPIGRSRHAFAKFEVREDGKKALTKFKLISKYKNEGKVYSLLEVDLKTGRTHQIRVHFSHLRWPLLGDKTYGSKDDRYLKRPFLHAHQIIFRHPIDDKEVKVESKMPDDLIEVLEHYEKY